MGGDFLEFTRLNIHPQNYVRVGEYCGRGDFLEFTPNLNPKLWYRYETMRSKTQDSYGPDKLLGREQDDVWSKFHIVLAGPNRPID